MGSETPENDVTQEVDTAKEVETAKQAEPEAGALQQPELDAQASAKVAGEAEDAVEVEAPVVEETLAVDAKTKGETGTTEVAADEDVPAEEAAADVPAEDPEAETPKEEPTSEPEAELEAVEEVKEKKKSAGQKIINGVCIFLCLLLLPILIANVIIIVKGSLHPDEIPTVGGVAPMAVITDSMNTEKADAIKAGDLVVTKSVDPDTLKVGDIIMFKSGNSAVIHRIVAYDAENKTYTTKGDANNTEDLDPVEQKNIIGKYIFKISKLGDFVLFSKTPLGMGVCIGIPLLLLFGYDFLADFFYKRKQKREAIQS